MSNLHFPDFKLFGIEDFELLTEYTNNFPPYSDFNLVSLWTYNLNEDTEYSWFNGNLIIKLRDYITNELLFSFLGTTNIGDLIPRLLTYIKDNEPSGKLELIPEICIKDLLQKENNFFLKEQQDQNDYIIPLKESAELTNINSHKAEKYHNFKKAYPDIEFKKLNLVDPKTQTDILDLFETWAKLRKNPTSSPNNELTALKRLLRYCSYFNIMAHGLFLRNKLIGFIADERLDAPYVLGHFIKADTRYDGIYEVLNQMTAQIHFTAGYKYINIEQDLGIKGLRISKIQRSPVFFLKKYSVSEN